MNELEEGLSQRVDWAKLAKVGAVGADVVPVVLQDHSTGEVLFVGYANEQALNATLDRREAVLWSTSRNELWHKGATSGDTLALVDIRVNCEQNSLLYLVRRNGVGVCHTHGEDGVARPGCYYRSLSSPRKLAWTGTHRTIRVPGAELQIPVSDDQLATEALSNAQAGFGALASNTDEQITEFFHRFADALADDALIVPVLAANAADVDKARAAGRSTTRLELSSGMRHGMVDGLRAWAAMAGSRDEIVEVVDHGTWRVEQRRAPLGVVGFVFEGRPNVFADACGVLRGGNTVVFRIGRDALGTARAIMEHALRPALRAAGLPAHAVQLLDSPSRATGWALFSHPQLSLAVARGSGSAVAQLGSVARQAGVAVSLHGTGGGWLVAGNAARASDFEAAVRWSLDRKVCNSLNVCVIPAARAGELVPAFMRAVEAAGTARNTVTKLHVASSAQAYVDQAMFEQKVPIRRAGGDVVEALAELIDDDELGTEWEWEDSPEVSIVVTDDLAAAVALCNRHSPRLVASLISDDADEQEQFWKTVDAPFVGNGFTRWVDGQFALGKPELGLSNWQHGRLFARSAVLSGDSVFTVRTRTIQSDPNLRR